MQQIRHFHIEDRQTVVFWTWKTAECWLYMLVCVSMFTQELVRLTLCVYSGRLATFSRIQSTAVRISHNFITVILLYKALYDIKTLTGRRKNVTDNNYYRFSQFTKMNINC